LPRLAYKLVALARSRGADAEYVRPAPALYTPSPRVVIFAIPCLSMLTSGRQNHRWPDEGACTALRALCGLIATRIDHRLQHCDDTSSQDDQRN
jgi:hypothetical protein